jgi:hypothetical protein
MKLTPYHAKYIAHELTRRCASDSVEKLTAVLADAQVDLNPHQIEAALFAFRNPLSRGAILADEVGLGKTIEAGLLIAQSWAEGKRRILVIVPANLRKQWSQELADKFFLPSVILEARTFNDTIRAGNLNPFQQNAVIICSYQFARKMEPYIRQTRWDLVVIDEAHRLRNVYKPTNKIANSIKQSVASFRKVLLTATPLQNSLLELYGLVSIIDDFAFGDLKTYRNFLNKGNAADRRVYELLDEKFRLFSGVFGASDEVLGAVESGVDFEKRIAAIYQKCRTPQQIQFEFDQLQRELDTEIAAGQRDAREKLLDNFDQEVVEKVRIQSAGLLDRFNERLWLLTQYLLADYARFDADQYSFYLTRNPFPGETIHPGPYRLGKNVEDANTYRVGHPLAQRVLAQAMALAPPPAEVVFDYSCGKKNIAALAPFVGKSGWLTCSRFGVQSLESEDTLILAGISDNHEPLDESACRRLFDLSGRVSGTPAVPSAFQDLLADAISRQQAAFLEALSAKNGQWFDTEMEKLDRWADDRRAALKAELEELDQEIKETKKSARMAPNLPEKLELQRKLRGLETKRDEAWRAYDAGSRDIDRQKDALLDEISRRLEQKTECKPLFTVRWKIT